MAHINDPRRIIALKMLSLNWLDRRWLLARLPVAARKPVQACFAELKRKGANQLSYQDVELLLQEQPHTSEDHSNGHSYNSDEHPYDSTLALPKGCPETIAHGLIQEADHRGSSIETSPGDREAYSVTKSSGLTRHVRQQLLDTLLKTASQSEERV